MAAKPSPPSKPHRLSELYGLELEATAIWPAQAVSPNGRQASVQMAAAGTAESLYRLSGPGGSCSAGSDRRRRAPRSFDRVRSMGGEEGSRSTPPRLRPLSVRVRVSALLCEVLASS